MARTRRIPFVLNIDDPVDAAIWEALQPMLSRHRASAFIRGAVAHALGMGGLLPPAVVPMLPSGEPVRAKRPTMVQTIEDGPLPTPDDEASVDSAASNFMSMFG
jgi:hypothetical protein